MWAGPYGDFGSRKYLLASLDQSLRRLRPRPRRHLLLPQVRPRDAPRGDDRRARHGRPSGKARYVGISSYGQMSARRPTSSARSAPHCSSTSRPTRCSTDGSRTGSSTCSAPKASAASPSPLAQGLLTDRYLGHRRRLPVRRGQYFSDEFVTPTTSTASRLSTASRPDDTSPWLRWPSPGPCATLESPPCSSAPAASPNSSRTSPPSTTSTSPPTSSRRSTATPRRVRLVSLAPVHKGDRRAWRSCARSRQCCATAAATLPKTRPANPWRPGTRARSA